MKNTTVLLILMASLLHVQPGYTQTFTDVSQRLDPVSNTGVSWGASAADFNSDGWVDIYHAGGNGHRLYLNRNATQFTDVLPASGIGDIDPSIFIWGGVFGDYNSDGFLDLVIIGADRLYRNSRNRTFVNETRPSVITFPEASQGPLWFDFDRNGRLDLFINDDFGNNRLFWNADNQSFGNFSEAAMVATVGNSYGAAASDFNNDGLADIFIATCSSDPRNSVKHLLRNNGNFTFTDVNVTAGVSDSSSSWGVVWVDYNNDGWSDLYVGNLPTVSSGENKLYRNNGDGTFTDLALAAGVAGETQEATYGVAAADFDNDGWMDLYAANRNSNRHRLYHNNGDGTFTDISGSAGITSDESPTVSVVDFNNDGWIDIFVPEPQQSQLFFNDGGSNHWLKIQLRGKQSTLFGIGARIEVFAGGLRQVKEINAGDGFVSQSHNLTAHFGLGSATQADSILVRWPGRGVERISSVLADQEITIVEGVGLNNPPAAPELLTPSDGALLQESQITFSWRGTADPEQDPLRYTLHLSFAGNDMEFDDLQDTTRTVDLSAVAAGVVISWSVSVTDGHSIVATTDLFSLQRDAAVSVAPRGDAPAGFALDQNYPNPFNPNTTIRFSLPQTARVSLVIYDLTGRRITTLLDGMRNAGTHSFVWDGRDASGQPVSSGIYVSKLQSGDRVTTRKMLLLK